MRGQWLVSQQGLKQLLDGPATKGLQGTLNLTCRGHMLKQTQTPKIHLRTDSDSLGSDLESEFLTADFNPGV